MESHEKAYRCVAYAVAAVVALTERVGTSGYGTESLSGWKVAEKGSTTSSSGGTTVSGLHLGSAVNLLKKEVRSCTAGSS